MAWDPAPSSWIANWAEGAGTVSFDLTDLSAELTAAEAHATTGDWRDCLFALLEHSYAYYYALASADKPAKLTINRSVSVSAEDVMTKTYTVRFTMDITGQDVASE